MDVDVKRLALRPGDVVVLTVPESFTDCEAEAAAHGVRQALDLAGHSDAPVVVHSAGCQIGLIGEDREGPEVGLDGSELLVDLRTPAGGDIVGKLAVFDGPVVPFRQPKGQVRWEVKARAGGTEGEVWIYGDIGFSWDDDGVTARQFAQDLQDLGAVATIHVYINSAGGSVFQGEAIYNSLRRHRARKIVHVDGMAASIASVIAMAGDEIRIARNGLMMIHDPEGCACGRSTDFRKMADSLDKIKDIIVDTYVLRTGGKADVIAGQMTEETWFNAEEAIAAGFADAIDEPVAVAAFSGIDVTAFKHAPDALAEAVAAAPAQPAPPDQPEASPDAKLHPAVAKVEARLRRRGLLTPA